MNLVAQEWIKMPKVILGTQHEIKITKGNFRRLTSNKNDQGKF
jgi:hypothetical protein